MRLEPGGVAVVTGAASGIGRGLAAEFGRRGLNVVLADVDAGEVRGTAAGLEEAGGRYLAVPTDVRDRHALEALAEITLAEFGRVDVFCANAGVLPARSASWEIAPRDVDWALDVNVKGILFGLRAFMPVLIAQGRGHIVHTASNVGLGPIPFLGLYSATKHAVVGLSWALREELAHACPGIGFTLLCPGGVRTRLHESGRLRPPAGDGTPERPPVTALPDRPDPRRILPEDVARQVAVAIERNQPLVVTDDDAVRGIREWLHAVEAELRYCPVT